ncbi:MAG: phosphatase PAP2 family protein [Pseudomonadota bacterium]|nr:phosphatase PAP2 family protein [Pseudomonadota bacterium]
MANARTRFWTAMILASLVWLLSLLHGGAGSGWDEELRRSLYADGNPALRPQAALLTLLGDAILLSVLTVAAAIYLYSRRKIRAGLLLLIVFGGRLLVELQKIIVNRDRPGLDEHLEAVYSMSFPSGHSANAMITYMAIALLVPVKQRNRTISVGLGLALALQAGWSRVALGVHWPSDVIGGWAFGLLWLAVCMRLASARGEGEPSAAAR